MSQNKGVNISKKDTNYKWVDCEKFQSMETQQKNETTADVKSVPGKITMGNKVWLEFRSHLLFLAPNTLLNPNFYLISLLKKY